MSEEKKTANNKTNSDTNKRDDAKATDPKPVVIPHRPMLKEPGASNDQTFVEKIPEEKQPMSGSIDVKLKPLTQSPVESTDTKDASPQSDDKAATPKKDDLKEADSETPPPDISTTKPEPEEVIKDAEPKEETSEKPETDGNKNPADLTSQEIDDKEAEKQAKHDAAIQKLVDEKAYFLPINAIEKRRTKRFVILGIILSVLLAVAWADVALDAGLIHIDGVKPVTHFFSN